MPMRLATLLVALWAALACVVSVAWGQEAAAPLDYEAWERVATRAETAVDAGRASNAAFESLRAEVVGWRDQFLDAQGANSARIATLQAQIEALGPAPDVATEEAPEIAERRVALQDQLAQARAPVTRAEEAYSRADGLAREITTIIRERQAGALFELGPSPLAPANWLLALTELERWLSNAGTEVAEAWASPIRQEALRDGLPIVILWAVACFVLLFQGRRISRWVRASFGGWAPERFRRLSDLLWSIPEIALPVAGVYAGVAAIEATGMTGIRTAAILSTVPQIGFYLLGSYWLGKRLFGTDHYLEIERGRSRVLRRGITALGLLYGLSTLIASLSQFNTLSPGTLAVLYLPFAVFAGLALWRLGAMLVRVTQAEAEAEDAVFGLRWLGYAGRVTMLFAAVGVVLVAVGYLDAGLSLLLPTIGSLALLGLLFVLDDFLRGIYQILVDPTDEGHSGVGLIPTLVTLGLALASLPLFALIWGARTADLTELLARVREGFLIGETRISPQIFLTFVVVFAALYIATRIIQGALRANVLPKTRIDTGGQTAIVSGVGYVGIFLAALIAITTAGIDLSSLAIVAGALSVGIGFGLQNIVQNFVSGIILLIERPVAEGDWVEVGGVTGIVRRISVRSTVVETFDKVDVIVPNGDFISGAVKNWTRRNAIGRIVVTVGVAYGTDTRRVSEILREIALEHPLVALDPEPGIDFLGFGADSLDFRIRAILQDINFGLSVKNEIHHRIAERFAEEGIEIPFAQRDIWLRNPEALRPAASAPAGAPGAEDQSGIVSTTPLEQELPADQIGAESDAPEDTH